MASPLFIQGHCVETTEVLELLNILCYKLPSLSELEEFYLLGISHTVREVFREELPPEGLPSYRLSSLLHDGLHAHQPVFSFSGEHINCKSQPVICWTHLCVEDSLQVFQPLIDYIWTSLPVEFHWMVVQEVLQAPLLDCRSWLRTKGGRSCSGVF